VEDAGMTTEYTFTVNGVGLFKIFTLTGITAAAIKRFTEKKQAAAADLVEGVDFVVVESRESL